MTHDPRLPTLEEVMNGNPFEIIDSPWGHIERWRASTLSTGTMGALAQVYDIVRNDAAEAVARVDAAEARKSLVQHLCDQVAAMQERMNRLADAYADAQEELLELRHRADQQREFEEEPLSLPPGEPAERGTVEDASMNKVSAREIIARDETHTPGGELHDLPPKDEGELPEPPLSTAADVELHPTDPALEDPLQTDLPEPSRGKVYPQPIAISLNEE